MDATGGGEFAAIRRLARLFPAIGDDCAVVDGLLLAADAVVEGVHGHDIEALGWKAVVANVSDVAAMGGRPRWLLVTVSGPPSTDLDRLYRGIDAAARAYDCQVVGGDLTNAPTLVVSVSIVGSCDGEPVLRSGAGVGDSVFVTGPLGAAAASGWTSRPSARVHEGTAAREAGATAMIDVSDGLGRDLGHICDASAVGVELFRVPVAEGATEEQALGGGEDYELVFTAPDAERVAEAFAEAGLVIPERIGVCVADVTMRPPAAGWEHAWS
ncbi:MAG: thiamine-phosphate kinase [Actinobacteria bacterium]|nr:thiamine-phosphate kinase [Actinomycetota bacterium]